MRMAGGPAGGPGGGPNGGKASAGLVINSDAMTIVGTTTFANRRRDIMRPLFQFFAYENTVQFRIRSETFIPVTLLRGAGGQERGLF
jgi:hypothetical protein